MSEINLKRIVEKQIDNFIYAGNISIELKETVNYVPLV